MTVAYAPDRGDLVWLEFTPQTGSEQAGRRPALVISPRAYNAKVGLALFCPVTSRVKGYPFEVALPEGSGVVGVVLADQLKSFDWRARKAKLIERASFEVLAMVTARILPLTVTDLEVRAVFPDRTIEISNFSSLASKPYKHHL